MLALELHSRFFFDITGTAICASLCALLSLALTALLRDRHTSLWQIAANLTPLLLPLVDVFGGGLQPWRGPVLLIGGLTLAALFITQVNITRRIGFLLAVAIPLAIYLPDISPYVGRADTFEFQLVAPRLGIAHPSGYPLYILVGKLFSMLPFGSVAWRVNLSSAMCAALASGVLFLTLNGESANRRIENRQSASSFQHPASSIQNLIAALTLAFSPTLWSRSIEAEVYALNALLVTTALWLAVRWTSGKLSTAKVLPLLGLLTGVAMASHVTLGALLFLALPLMLTSRPRPTWRTLLLSAALGLGGLCLYLYIPLRWPAVNNGETMSLAHFLRFVTNAESGGALHPLAFIQDPTRWSLVLRLLRMQVGWIGLALALWGLLQLFRRRWPLALGSLLAFGAWVWFNLSFYVADPDFSAFLIPGHVILIFWMGVGMQISESANQRIDELRITHHASRISAQPPRGTHSPCSAAGTSHASRFTFYVLRFTPYVLTTLLALLPLSRLWTTGPALDTISVGRDDEAWARYTLRQPLADAAAVLADSEKFPPLYYLQQIEGIRSDLELVMLFNEAQYREAMETRLAAGQRVYLARYLPGLDAYGVRSAGPLVEVRPPSSPLELHPTPEARFGDALELNSHRIEEDPEERPMHHLTLVWHATQPVKDDLSVRLRLVDAMDNVVWENQASRPVGGYTTTQAWQPDDVVADYHALQWPAWLPEGRYHLEIGLFPRFSERGLVVTPGTGDWHALGTIVVPDQEAKRQRSQQLNIHFSDISVWLEGADVPGEAWASSDLTLDLVWHATRPPSGDANLVARWVAANGTPLPSADIVPTTPAPLPDGHAIRRYTIHTPEAAGQYRLRVGWRTSDGPVLGRCGWLEMKSDFCTVSTINVGPSNAGLANFDDRILLLDAAVDADAVAAGGQLHVDLRWRGQRALDKDYTIFVQIVGPDGKLYGQVDSWPVQGARPTSGWRPGEEIEDAYALYLKADALSGQYQVIVGWYLLADMGRLPVVDEDGQAIGDFYIVGAFSVP